MNDDLTRLNATIAKANKTAVWDGWKIEIFTENPTAYYSPSGVFRNGKYGYLRVVEPNSKGVWTT